MEGGSLKVTGIAVFNPPIQGGIPSGNAIPFIPAKLFFSNLLATRKSDGRRQKNPLDIRQALTDCRF
ncbi:hypothetical protein AFK69_19670 [Xenorhabdus sp. GDc328]|nr:hypothetical protein AAY47_13375 [Xenorhabdus griffiniae]KOP31676.1 hypothetical protein AFK69_19670 [Xenorhabdus sp. GDc328]